VSYLRARPDLCPTRKLAPKESRNIIRSPPPGPPMIFTSTPGHLRPTYGLRARAAIGHPAGGHARFGNASLIPQRSPQAYQPHIPQAHRMPGPPVAVDQPPCPVRPSGWPVDPGPTYLGDRKEKSNIHLQVSNKNSSSYIISNWSTHPSRRASDHQSRFPFPPSPSPFTEITASAGLSSLLICIVWFSPPLSSHPTRTPTKTNQRTKPIHSHAEGNRRVASDVEDR
jgi:hypothetical protein